MHYIFKAWEYQAPLREHNHTGKMAATFTSKAKGLQKNDSPYFTQDNDDFRCVAFLNPDRFLRHLLPLACFPTSLAKEGENEFCIYPRVSHERTSPPDIIGDRKELHRAMKLLPTNPGPEGG